MSTCLKKETLLAFVDREMLSSEMELAESHVTACAVCRKQLDAIRATSLKVNALIGSLAPNDGATAEQIAVVRIPERVANPGMRWGTVAAVSVLAVAVAVFVMIRRTQTVTPPE